MDNQKPTMTRGQYRKQRTPFYKKAPFIITLVVILIAIIAGIIYWSVGNTHKKNAENNSNRVENVQSNKSTKKKNSGTKSAASQKVAKEDSKEKSDDKKTDKKKTYSNPGSYNNLDYKTDDFEFKIGNDVKLVKDSTGNSALLIQYTYTNKSKKNQIPQKVQYANMILKQNDKELVPTGGDGDYSELVSKSNMGEVIPGATFEGALLVQVPDANADVNMYFKNIQTGQYLNTMQPFKLS
ncbi:DUF5067 domain-containing protein [Companilactobacillus ginsenosidimutans]|uniref:DUF5067 domain-containing protein n=1 Tax=Companilactobacillus ginsenosidimutans TaxID=1007676 RepID=A0A0H4QIY7_9LACO|nr:DUF5067 domain-containing protein [Companilactobacillus ginsenosidimutans]AKP66991.1 hypothetical protein ABM34_05195 [Companilactobacillus ginsenosidimutans]